MHAHCLGAFAEAAEQPVTTNQPLSCQPHQVKPAGTFWRHCKCAVASLPYKCFRLTATRITRPATLQGQPAALHGPLPRSLTRMPALHTRSHAVQLVRWHTSPGGRGGPQDDARALGRQQASVPSSVPLPLRRLGHVGLLHLLRGTDPDQVCRYSGAPEEHFLRKRGRRAPRCKPLEGCTAGVWVKAKRGQQDTGAHEEGLIVHCACAPKFCVLACPSCWREQSS